LEALIEDLRDTMAARDGAGLAAPQIGIPLRLVIFGIGVNPRYPDAPPIPETVLINPEITPLDQARESGWEGCLRAASLCVV
jgi:peptide deformylase